MAIKFACQCGKTIKAPAEKAGKKVACPACGDTVTVPVGSDSAEIPVAPAAPVASAGSAAGELMKRAAEASKKAKKGSGELPVHGEEEEEKPSVAEIASFVGVQVLPGVVVVILASIVVYWLSSLLLTKKVPLPPLGSARGIVTLDDKPLARATVMFRPAASDQPGVSAKDSVSVSMGITDDAGRFTLMYVEGVPGAVVGDHRVEIHALSPEGMEQVSEKYRIDPNMMLKATVKQGQNDEFKFNLKSNP